MKKFDYDLVVIGGGAAGIAGAMMAAAAKKKVAIVEKDLIGGGNTLCAFSRLMAGKISQLLCQAREGSSVGLNSDQLKINLPSMYSEIQNKTEEFIEAKQRELLESKVEVIRSSARFISPIEVATSERTITAKKFLIASGTTISTGEVAGLEETGFVTPAELYLGLPRIPKVALVIGAGQSGVEASEFLANLGSSVILIEMNDRILPKEDLEASKIIEVKFNQKKSIKILTETKVVSVENDGIQTLATGRKTKVIKASLLRGGQKKSVRVECVVLAAGQKPELDLGLENANVKYTPEGILVSNQMQTSNKNIFAAGGVATIKENKKISDLPFSSYEKDTYEGAIAASVAFNGRSKTIVENNGFVRMTNTYPKVASVGITEEQCAAMGLKYTSAISGLTQKEATWSPSAEDGFVKIICNREKKILGATIVAPNAEILIQEISLAMRNGLTVVDVAAAPHVGMSLAEAVRVTARKLL